MPSEAETKAQNETSQTRIITAGIALVVCVAIVSMTSCSIRQIPLDEAKNQQSHEMRIEQVRGENAKNDAIKTMVSDMKVDPIAARCAILGWNTEREAEICRRFTPSASAEQQQQVTTVVNAQTTLKTGIETANARLDKVDRSISDHTNWINEQRRAIEALQTNVQAMAADRN